MQDFRRQGDSEQTVPLALAAAVFIAIVIAAAIGGFFVGHTGSLPPAHAAITAALR